MIDTPVKQESKPRRREDILVSVCFGELELSEDAFERVRVLAAQIDAVCRFWEFVFVVFVDEAEAYEQLVCDIVNLRLVKVRRGSDFYQRRAVAASEAIGDVVVLTTTAELNYLDVPAIIDRANADGCIVIGQRDSNHLLSRIIAWPLALIGRGAGFNVDIRDLLTIAFPRTLLNQVLTHMDRDLALRFPPRDGAFPFVVIPVANCGTERRSVRELGRRLGLMQKLLINLAPWFLGFVTVVSGLTVLLAAFYSVYAIIAWLFLASVEPGWLTLSLMLGSIAFLLGCALFGLSLGLQNLLHRLERSEFDSVVGEVNNVDLFGRVARELNVQVDIGTDNTSAVDEQDSA